MADFRLYFMTAGSVRIERLHEFDAVDDSAAIAVAEGIEGMGARELWIDARLVRRWESSKSHEQNTALRQCDRGPAIRSGPLLCTETDQAASRQIDEVVSS